MIPEGGGSRRSSVPGRHVRHPAHRAVSVAVPGRTRETQVMATSDLPKIGAPATRALASIGVTRLDDLANRSETELLGLHGFGPRALGIIREALAVEGKSMRT